jgi:hypothetical protein
MKKWYFVFADPKFEINQILIILWVSSFKNLFINTFKSQLWYLFWCYEEGIESDHFLDNVNGRIDSKENSISMKIKHEFLFLIQ